MSTVQQNISLRLPAEDLEKIDFYSSELHMRRSSFIKAALRRHMQYLEWYRGMVQEGLEDMREGRSLHDFEVKARVERLLGRSIDV